MLSTSTNLSNNRGIFDTTVFLLGKCFDFYGISVPLGSLVNRERSPTSQNVPVILFRHSWWRIVLIIVALLILILACIFNGLSSNERNRNSFSRITTVVMFILYFKAYSIERRVTLAMKI